MQVERTWQDEIVILVGVLLVLFSFTPIN